MSAVSEKVAGNRTGLLNARVCVMDMVGGSAVAPKDTYILILDLWECYLTWQRALYR